MIARAFAMLIALCVLWLWLVAMELRGGLRIETLSDLVYVTIGVAAGWVVAAVLGSLVPSFPPPKPLDKPDPDDPPPDE